MQGPAGPQGVAGPPGTAGAVTATSTVHFAFYNVVAADAGRDITVSAPCPAGTVLTGGSATANGQWFIGPNGAPSNNAWIATGRASPAGLTAGSALSAFAVCLHLQ